MTPNYPPIKVVWQYDRLIAICVPWSETDITDQIAALLCKHRIEFEHTPVGVLAHSDADEVLG